MNLYLHEFKDASLSKINSEFIIACSRNDLNLVRFLLTSKELRNNADIHFLEDYALATSCIYGRIEIVKYLTNSPELGEKILLYPDVNNCVKLASVYGHLDLVKYLLSSEEFKSNPDIDGIQSTAFFEALGTKPMNVLEYFILEKNIRYSSKVHEYLINNPDEEIQRLFELRELNHKLHIDLIINISDTKKSKV